MQSAINTGKHFTTATLHLISVAVKINAVSSESKEYIKLAKISLRKCSNKMLQTASTEASMEL